MNSDSHNHAHAARRPHRQLNPLFIVTILSVALAILLLIAILMIVNPRFYKIVTVEAGTALPEAQRFLADNKNLTLSYGAGIDQVQLDVPGDYPVTICWDNKSTKATIRVVDTVAPMGVVQPLEALRQNIPAAKDFFLFTKDVTAVTARYESAPDLQNEQPQQVTLILEDAGGNETRYTTTLTVKVDREGPTFVGLKNIDVYQGKTVSYRNGVTVKDNYDEAPTFQVDSSAVDLSTIGQYPVTYTATDASGNQTVVTITVSVLEKRNSYVEMDVINAEVEKVLSKIITDSMTDLEKIQAIYKWVHSNCSYYGTTFKDDWRQAGYKMLTTRMGDCYYYFGVCKLMFEYLGIPNIDVKKVKNYEGDSNHFWHLVSADGGQTYYHFDTTPRRTGGSFYMLTDKEMDDYSKKYNNCFNRDKSLYPATPETKPW